MALIDSLISAALSGPDVLVTVTKSVSSENALLRNWKEATRRLAAIELPLGDRSTLSLEHQLNFSQEHRANLIYVAQTTIQLQVSIAMRSNCDLTNLLESLSQAEKKNEECTNDRKLGSPFHVVATLKI